MVDGSQAILDFDDCDSGDCTGQGWVRVAGIFPSTTSFPAQDEDGRCASVLAATIEIGIVRCGALPDDQGNPPSVARYLEVVKQQTADMASIRRALCVTMKDRDNAWVLGAYVPVASGGVSGGAWTVTIQQDF